MSDPTYSGYIKWITITSILLSTVISVIILFFFAVANLFTTYEVKEILTGSVLTIGYLIIFIIMWFIIFRYSTYEDYLKRE